MTEPVNEERRYVVDPVTGELVDPVTGEVIEDHPIDLGREWRAFDSDEWYSRARAGGRLTAAVHDYGLHTRVGDARLAEAVAKRIGVHVVARYREKVRALRSRLERLNERTRISYQEKKLVELLTYVNNYGAILSLPKDVIDEAARIARKALSVVGFKRPDFPYVAIASLLFAAKSRAIPISMNAVVRRLNLEKKRLWQVMTEIQVRGIAKPAVVPPELYIDKMVSELNLSGEVAMLARRIIHMLRAKHAVEGKDPNALAAAAIYIASILLDSKRTQRQVAQVAGVTEVTVRNRYRDIVARLVIEVLI